MTFYGGRYLRFYLFCHISCFFVLLFIDFALFLLSYIKRSGPADAGPGFPVRAYFS